MRALKAATRRVIHEIRGIVIEPPATFTRSVSINRENEVRESFKAKGRDPELASLKYTMSFLFFSFFTYIL